MKSPYKQTLIFFLILLLLSLLVGYFYYGRLNHLVFINTSFFISSMTIGISLLFLVTKNGFFDGITFGFRKIFASKQVDKELEEDIRNKMRPPSELVEPVSVFPMFAGSIILFACMLFSLYAFYNN